MLQRYTVGAHVRTCMYGVEDTDYSSQSMIRHKQVQMTVDNIKKRDEPPGQEE